MAKTVLPATECLPPADLFDRILLRLALERRLLIARRKFIVGLIAACVVAVIAIPVCSILLNDLVRSGFSQYASLLILDSNAALASWQDFSLSLLESFPVVDMAIFTAIILALLLAIRSVVVYGEPLLGRRSSFPLAHK